MPIVYILEKNSCKPFEKFQNPHNNTKKTFYGFLYDLRKKKSGVRKTILCDRKTSINLQIVGFSNFLIFYFLYSRIIIKTVNFRIYLKLIRLISPTSTPYHPLLSLHIITLNTIFVLTVIDLK